jgi:hypothetical protein
LIPALAEPGRGYDAVLNSGMLMSILRRYGFHLVLHGHKHYPCTFTEDVSPAFQKLSEQPVFISGVGSIGSTSLPNAPKSSNCYNRITIKWHPAARQSRTYVRTRGLTVFNEDFTERVPGLWYWITLKDDDRTFVDQSSTPMMRGKTEACKFDGEKDGLHEEERQSQYRRTRGNLAVAEILPSLEPGQAYEARCWIVGHNRKNDDIPREVTWSAGEWFEVITMERAEDPHFCTTFTYWGPMLVQARLRFQDGEEQCTYVYARIPASYGFGRAGAVS